MGSDCHAGLDPASIVARQHGLRVKPAMTFSNLGTTVAEQIERLQPISYEEYRKNTV
jgi:hypothetical protein